MKVVALIEFEVKEIINRSVDQVFAFVAKGENNSKWNSAVTSVTKISDGPAKRGAQYAMTRKLPNGTAKNIYEIVDYEPNRTLTIKIISGPTPFTYRYEFKPVDDATELSMKAQVDKEGVVEVLGLKARIAPELVLSGLLKKGVETNFQTLKKILESA